MGILNVTPDSFSNEGEHFDPDVAIQHALSMVEQGADIIDIGGESTRPGASRVTVVQQIERVVPVITAIVKTLTKSIPISIDTTSSVVAQAAFAAGASIINDVSAGREDRKLLSFAAEAKAPLMLMHMQGQPANMQDAPHYDNVIDEIKNFLIEHAHIAESMGVESDKIFIDPGIGFGKTRQNNLDLIANLSELISTGYGVLLGASRKRFMGSICNIEKFSELVGATCTTTTFAVLAGVKIIRVHDIKENRQAIDVAYALKQSMKSQ
ncbi:MAG: dihydropteroate synthase [Planctomycetota bacterium]|jgi:dihydropteroate synthase